MNPFRGLTFLLLLAGGLLVLALPGGAHPLLFQTDTGSDPGLEGGTVISQSCGNGLIGVSEQCDLGAQNGIPCEPQYGSACTYCSDRCTLSTEFGPSCGDGMQNGNEDCDALDMDGATCQSLGFTSGPLSCYSSTPAACTFNTSACAAPILLHTISPTQVFASASTLFTVTGTGFLSGDTVQLIGITGTPVLISSPAVNGSTLTFSLTPAYLGLLGAGTATVRVVRGSLVSNFLFLDVMQSLALSSVEPAIIGIEWPSSLVLRGHGFNADSRVSIGGQLLDASSIYLGGSEILYAYPSGAFIQGLGVGRHLVQVENSGGVVSDSEFLTVGPFLASIGPSAGVLDGRDTDLTLYGSNLYTYDRVIFTGTIGTVEKYPTGYSGSALTVTLTDAEKAHLGLGAGTISMERSGQFESNPLSFTIVNPIDPRIESISPSSLAYNAASTLQINGQNLGNETRILVGDELILTPTFVDPAHTFVLAALTPADTAGLGTGNHWIAAQVGALRSNELLFSIQDPLPVVTSVNPAHPLLTLSPTATLAFHVEGVGFQSYSRVRITSENAVVTLSSNRLEKTGDSLLSGELTSDELSQLGYGTHTLAVVNGTLPSSTSFTLTFEPGTPTCGDGWVSEAEVCDPPGASRACTSEGVPGYQYCTSACTGYSACFQGMFLQSSGGDVLVLKRISSSTTFRAADPRRFEFEIRDSRVSGSSFDVALTIENSNGAVLLQDTITTSVPASGLISVMMDPGMTLGAGDTYTLRARLVPVPGETIIGNNSATTAFTILAESADQSFSVPDSPAWMGLVMMILVGAWLFTATRTKK